VPKKKLKRILTLPSFENVINNPFYYKGEWHVRYFHNSNPITIELGCGKGDYVLQLAQDHPERNFLGFDLKGARLFMGATNAENLGLDNIGFVQMNIDQIGDIFGENEVSDIWITFPDPYPRYARANKRLTSPRLLNIYREFLSKDGVVQFKTDDDRLYKFTLATINEEHCHILKNYPDLYGENPTEKKLLYQTTYEKRHLEAGKTIKYVEFSI
jgi:tRNA (guanine-N7-)-methyltransferase